MIETLDAIMEVMDAAFDPHWGEAWTRGQVVGSLQMPHTHYLVVDPDGGVWTEGHEPAAFLLSRYSPGEEELLLIAVEPQYRRRGLGRRLLDRLSSDAKGRGAERIFLEMRENNDAGILYREYGFQPIGRRKKYYTLTDGSRLDAITFGCDV